MLKLQRNSQGQEISVAFRSKERFFNRPFLIALSVALAIHIGLILMFHIAPIKIRWSTASTLPTIVETDLAQKEGSSVTASFTVNELTDRLLSTAPPSLPLLADTPIFSKVHHFELNEGSSSIFDLFNDIEQEAYLPAFSPANASSLKPISVIISGPLAIKILLNDPLKEINNVDICRELKVCSPKQLCYFVRVDEQTGKVFWHESINPSENGAVEAFAVKIIYGLQFETSPIAFVSKGSIELHFNPDARIDSL